MNLACDALGLDPLDPRGLTVTGGLPYAGGAGQRYLMHAIATVVERLRADGGIGARHRASACTCRSTSAAIYSQRARLDGDAATCRPRSTAASRAGHWSTATTAPQPSRRTPSPTTGTTRRQIGLLVLDVPDGRTLARVHEPELLADAESRELVGADGHA